MCIRDRNKADRKTEQAQGTDKEGTAAEESSAETEKNGTGTDKPKDTGNNESGPEKTREGGEAGEAGREPSPDGSQADAEAAADQGLSLIHISIGRFKYTEEADLDKVYEDVIKTLESEINSELSRKEDF